MFADYRGSLVQLLAARVVVLSLVPPGRPAAGAHRRGASAPPRSGSGRPGGRRRVFCRWRSWLVLPRRRRRYPSHPAPPNPGHPDPGSGPVHEYMARFILAALGSAPRGVPRPARPRGRRPVLRAVFLARASLPGPSHPAPLFRGVVPREVAARWGRLRVRRFQRRRFENAAQCSHRPHAVGENGVDFATESALESL